MEGRAVSCSRLPSSTESHPRQEPLYLLLRPQAAQWAGAGKGEEASVDAGVKAGVEEWSQPGSEAPTPQTGPPGAYSAVAILHRGSEEARLSYPVGHLCRTGVRAHACAQSVLASDFLSASRGIYISRCTWGHTGFLRERRREGPEHPHHPL